MLFFIPTINRWVRKQCFITGRAFLISLVPSMVVGTSNHLLGSHQPSAARHTILVTQRKMETSLGKKIEIRILRNQIKVTLLRCHFIKTAPKICKIQILNSSSLLQKTCKHSAPAASSHFDPDLLPVFLHLLPLFPPAIVGQPLFAG